MRAPVTDSTREVLFEFYQVGNAVKVSAVDCATMVEVSIVGAPTMTEAMLKRAALRKLDYIIHNAAEPRPSGAPRSR